MEFLTGPCHTWPIQFEEVGNQGIDSCRSEQERRRSAGDFFHNNNPVVGKVNSKLSINAVCDARICLSSVGLAQTPLLATHQEPVNLWGVLGFHRHYIR